MLLTNTELLNMDIQASFWKIGLGYFAAQLVDFIDIQALEDHDPHAISEALNERLRQK